MSQALSFNDVSLVPVPVTNSPFTLSGLFFPK